MGAANARRVFMSAHRFDAGEAASFGALAKVVPADGLDAAIEVDVTPYLFCAPIDTAVIGHTINALASRWESPESAEGIPAFFEKRSPAWSS